ncbi:hypothetical protein M673_04935 [Aureimonas sp. AU20]|uniref:metallophosphoesterase family protein n=1 Tax=Aureimonas sp. AU20 TaxID=1349819 RepID=UPI000720EC3D|nr:metallophosphoesterase family protein [Aureimonas sp. AU20]ALN72050.1 hypothetical protein M673_04935 [Aureimonas sp. AU20]
MVNWFSKRLLALSNGRAKPSRSEPGREPLPRLALPGEPTLIYAIGDVHGCLDKLQQLEKRIVADGKRTPGLKLIVMLGDYVDRGPNSAGVLDHLIAPPPEGFRRVCLRGNHDDMLLRFVEGSVDPEWWLEFGGTETLFSYGYDLQHLAGNRRRALSDIMLRFAQEIPHSHLAFLKRLPVVLSTPRYFFCHAGARPGVPLEAQSDEDLMWVRGPFLEHDGPPFERTVIHGHTPTKLPFLSRYRIGVDTNACRGGKLSVARLASEGVKVLSV